MSETNRLLAVYLPDNILLPKSFAHLLSLRDAFNDWCRDSCSSGDSTPLEQFVDNVDGDDDNDELLLSNNIDQACKTLMNQSVTSFVLFVVVFSLKNYFKVMLLPSYIELKNY